MSKWKPDAPITTPAKSSPTIVGKLSLTNTSANALAAKNINRNLITPISVSATSKSCALNSASKGYILNARKIKLSNWKIVYGGPTLQSM